MQILTPTGYKDASTLSIGDEVSAFDINTGAPIINTILDIRQVTDADYLQLHNYQPAPFKYIRINGTYSYFQDQSIWANGVVVHASELNVGDTIYSDTDTDITVTSLDVIDDLNYWWRLEVSGDASYIADGFQVHNASRFWVLGTGTWDASTTTQWSNASGGAGGSSVPGVSDNATFDNLSGGGTVTVNTNVSITNLIMGAFTGTLDFSVNNNTVSVFLFSNSGTGTRTINYGSGQWSLTGNSAGIWNEQDLTNCTKVGNPTVNCTYSGSVGNRTIGLGTTNGSESTIVSFNVTAGTDTILYNSGSQVGTINYTGFSGTLGSSNVVIYGDLTIPATATSTGGAQTYTFSKSSGTQSITTSGTTVDRPVIIGNGTSAGTVVFTDGWIGSTRTLTVTSGTLNDNGKTLSFNALSSTNSNTRTIAISGTLNLSGNSTTVWNTAGTTGLTVTQTGTINLTYSGSTGTRSIRSGTLAENNSPSFNITAGSDLLDIATSIKDLNLTGFSGTFVGNVNRTIYGNLTLPATATTNFTGGTMTFGATSGTKTVDTNSVSITQTTAFNGAGGTWNLLSGLTVAPTFQCTLSAGALNFNNFNTSFGLFNSNNSATRSLSMGSGTCTLTGTSNVWNITNNAGLTFNAGTSTIVINNSSATGKTITGGPLNYNKLYLTGGGTGVFTVQSNSGTPMTFNTFQVDAGLTVNFFAGRTVALTSASGWQVRGTAGNLITLASTTSGTQWLLTCPSGNVSSNYVSLQDSNASGGAAFYAGLQSTNVSNNTGWIFTNPPIAAQNVALDENSRQGIFGASIEDGETPRYVTFSPTTHGMSVIPGTAQPDNGNHQGNAILDENSRAGVYGLSSAGNGSKVIGYVDDTGHLLIEYT